MKPSKLMHIVSVLVGFAGVMTFVGTLVGGADDLVFGVTKLDVLLCSAILILIATWLQIGTIHHMLLERKGEIV